MRRTSSFTLEIIVLKTYLTAAVVAASIPLTTAAQTAAGDPAAAADAPPPSYRSAFSGLATGVEQGAEDWKKANAAVAQFPRGHADLLKWEAQQRPDAPAGAASAARPPASAASSPAAGSQLPPGAKP
jgi:uncharacterized membrane protein